MFPPSKYVRLSINAIYNRAPSFNILKQTENRKNNNTIEAKTVMNIKVTRIPTLQRDSRVEIHSV